MSDTFRKEYKPLSGIVIDDIFVFKSKAEQLFHEFDAANLRQETDKRMMELAKTNLEQAIMWAIKSIT